MRRHPVLVIAAVALSAIACDKDENAPSSTGTTSGTTAGQVTPQPARPTQPSQPPPSTQPAPEASQIDRQFIDMMVPHHEQGTEMAKIAIGRAQHPELKTLMQKMVEDHRRDITAMKGLREQWFGTDATPPMAEMPLMPGMTMTPAMHRMTEPGSMHAELDKAKPFDKVFLDRMIEHHEAAIRAADMELAQGSQDELKTLSKKIRDEEQRELDQLQSYRRQWYGAK